VSICADHVEHHNLNFKCSLILFYHVYMIVVKSFVELTRYLLRCDGISYILGEKLCQDPLESFFWKAKNEGKALWQPNSEKFSFWNFVIACAGFRCSWLSQRKLQARAKKATYCCGLHTIGEKT